MSDYSYKFREAWLTMFGKDTFLYTFVGKQNINNHIKFYQTIQYNKGPDPSQLTNIYGASGWTFRDTILGNSPTGKQ